jgi:hypothetical protein
MPFRQGSSKNEPCEARTPAGSQALRTDLSLRSRPVHGAIGNVHRALLEPRNRHHFLHVRHGRHFGSKNPELGARARERAYFTVTTRKLIMSSCSPAPGNLPQTLTS